MRVLHICPQLFDAAEGVIGGAERYVWELARAMAGEVDTTLLSFGASSREFREGPLRVVVIGGSHMVAGQANNPVSLRVLPEVLRANVVHCHQEHILVTSLVGMLGRVARRKVFVSDLGGGGWDISAYVSTAGLFSGHLHISEYSLRNAGQEVNPKAHVILGGVDAARFSPDPTISKTLETLFVGRLLPHKGVDRLIEALPFENHLSIFGRPYDERYLARLRELASGKKVTFHFEAADSELISAYRRARCIVLPSVYRDCYGNETRVPELLGQTLLEGMACGLPAICTDVASMPEVVVHGVTGLVVPHGELAALRNAIEFIHENRARAEAMGTAARQHVLTKFKWSDVVQRCLQAYRS